MRRSDGGGEAMAADGPAVLYRDEWLLAVDKPQHLLVHADGTGERTLTELVAVRLASRGVDASGLQALQRLDRETSGVVLFSLDKHVQPAFDALVAARGPAGMRKRYLAVVSGRFPADLHAIEAPIGRDRHDSRRMRVSATGKPARTRIRLVAVRTRRLACSLLSVELDTGRRHQIRVHLASRGFPLMGDALYGGSHLEMRLMLHAVEESFTHPITHDPVCITSPIPPRFLRLFPQVTPRS